MSDTRRQYADLLNDILGESGLAYKGTNFTPSLAQYEFAERFNEGIMRSIENRAKQANSPASLVLMSADTGTGKTMGYATPLLIHAAILKSTTDTAGLKQVAIATHTHALQAQFFGTAEAAGDLVKIQNWLVKLGHPKLKIARRMGKQAFVSLSAIFSTIERLRENRSKLGLVESDFEALERLVQYAEESNKGHNDGLIEDIRNEFGGVLPCNLTAVHICLDEDSDLEDCFSYSRHLEVAHDADVLILSHAYLASCAQYRQGRLSERGVDVLVIDEADRLADVASNSFQSELSLRRVEGMLKKINSKYALEAFNSFEALSSFLNSQKLSKGAITLQELAGSKRENIIQLVTTAKINLDNLLNLKLKTLSDDARDSFARTQFVMSRFLLSAKKEMETNADLKNGSGFDGGIFASAISFSPVRSLPSLLVLPTNPGLILSRLWNVKDNEAPVGCVLFTSATLGSPGRYPDAIKRFNSIANDLGVSIKEKTYQRPEFDLWSYFEPERFGAVRFILSDPSVPNPTISVNDEMAANLSPEWIDYSVKVIREANKSGGRTLVLTCGYADSRLLAMKLLEHGITVIEQLKGQSTRDCQQQFLADQQSIWLTPTGWEGLNLPGQISNVVIPRIPFRAVSPADRALLSSSGRLTGKSIDSILSAKMMNNTKRKLRQGMFRAIRSAADKSRIYIADPRFPLDVQSQIPLKHPGHLKYGNARLYPALHSIIPNRFQRAFANASVLKTDGSMLE